MAEVAQKVASRSNHLLDGNTLTVTLFHPLPPKPCYQNRVLIQGLNNAITEEFLRNFLETKTKAQVTEFLYGEEDGNVVVTLSDNIDIVQLGKIFQESSVEGVFLKVARVAISNCILVQNLHPSTSHDVILYYFENKRSGGGDVERVEMKTGERYCLIYFEDPSDNATLEDENTDNQAKDKTSSSLSSNPEKESDFVEVQEWQENDRNNYTLPLWIKYKRAPDKKIIKCNKNIPCSWNFHLYWNFYTKTEPGKQMLHEILNKYNCSVAAFADDEDLFIFEIFEKIFEQESDVVQLIHVVLDSVHKYAQQFLYLDNILVDQRIQGDVLEIVRQRKELDIARFELMGQQDFDALCVICTEKDQTLVLHVVTEIIHMVKECFENHEEIIDVDHKWQKVMKTFGYLQKLSEKYPSVTVTDKTEAAIMLKGPKDQSKPAAGHYLKLLGTASSEVQEDIFSPGCQFEIFTYPEMCGYIDNIAMEHSIVWIPNHQTKKIHIFSKKSEKKKGVDKFIRGCVQERLYPFAKDQTVFSTKIIRFLEELKKMHTGKMVFSSSHKGLLLTATDDIFESIDDAVQEIICKETELEISRVHEDAEGDRSKTTIAEKGQFPKQSNENEDQADTTILQKLETAVAGTIVKKASDMGKLDALVKEIKEKSGVEVIMVGNQVCLKGVTAIQMQIAQSCLEEFCEVNLHILLRQGRKITSPLCSQDGRYLVNKIEGVSEIEFKALNILTDDINAKSTDVVWKDDAILITTLESTSDIMQTLNIQLNALRGRQMEEIFLDEDDKNVVRDVIAEMQSKDAICVYDEEKGQVIMYCVRQDDIWKFKHKLKFKSGKLKETGRSSKLFVQGTQSMEASLENSSSSVRSAVIRNEFSWSKDASSVEVFYTKEKIKVAVYTADILNLPVDCIVNAANDRMQHGGGVAKVIADAAGPELVQEGDAIIMKKGRIPVGGQVITTAGGLQYRCIIHTVGPCWSDYQPHNLQNVQKCAGDLYAAIYGCFTEAERNDLSTVALPAVSSGIYSVPQEMCAVQYVRAVLDYSAKSEQGKSLTEIHFIDKLPHLVKLMQDTFRSMIKNGNVPNYNIQKYVASPSNYQQVQSKETGRKGHKDYAACLSSSQRKHSEETGRDGHKNGTHAANNSQYETAKSKELSPLCYESNEHHKKHLIFQVSVKPVVHIYEGNILELKNMDAIACLDDTKGSGIGMIASELLKMPQYKKMKQKCFQSKRHDLGDVVIAYGEDSPFNMVVHVVIENNSSKKPEFKSTMKKSFDNILRKTNDWIKVKTIAMPLFGLKDGLLTEKSWTELFLDRFVAFCLEVQKPNLEEVHIIIYNSPMVFSTLKKCFLDFANQISKPQPQDSLTAPRQPLPNLYKVAADDAQNYMANRGNVAKDDGDAEDSCIICMCPKTDPKALSCGHSFCSGCIDQMFEHKPVCPVCGKIVGTLTGDQPKNGKMEVMISKFDLAGYEGHGSIVITYGFPAGTQEPNHPSPGKWYTRMMRTAYLPNTSEGRIVCRMLQLAFKRRLVFTIGQSRTTGMEGLTWNDIHHKTNSKPRGQLGYPDPEYLSRVKEELASKGITEADLPPE